MVHCLSANPLAMAGVVLSGSCFLTQLHQAKKIACMASWCLKLLLWVLVSRLNGPQAPPPAAIPQQRSGLARAGRSGPPF